MYEYRIHTPYHLMLFIRIVWKAIFPRTTTLLVDETHGIN